MAAIVSSDALGLATSSLATLGPRATSGNVAQDRGTERGPGADTRLGGGGVVAVGSGECPDEGADDQHQHGEA